MKFKLANLFTLLMLLHFTAQSQSDEQEALYDLSLEELMNITIESVSKTEESLFEAPLSSYTITQQEIIQAGITSIPEALKLCPGIIVREMTNGTYDFHIRGFDNPTQYTLTSSQVNLLTLVMIDNRPVFNHNNGGTIWETLPVDINDVDRIEIVRGPAAALYGPNAVTGVINIITKDLEKEGFSSWANLQQGSFNSTIANATLGFKPNDKFDFSVSANYQNRERTTNEYYEFYRDSYFTADQQLLEYLPYGSSFFLPMSETELLYIPLDTMPTPNANDIYQNPELALNKYGVNTFINYNAAEDINFELTAGTNQVVSQRALFNNVVSSLSTLESQSNYANLQARIKNASVRTSYLQGVENLMQGRPGLEYDFNVFDFIAEYDFSISENLMIRPSVSMQQASYTDLPYTNEMVPGILNAEQKFINYAGAVRIDYRPVEKLRLIAGLRGDHFNNPDDIFYSYQLSATYLVNDNLLIRGAFSKATSGSYMGNTYSNFGYTTNLAPMGIPALLQLEYEGNTNLDIFQSQMFEFGIRKKITEHLQLDLDVFSQNGINMTGFIKQPQSISLDAETGLPLITVARNVENLDTRIRMNGVTFSAKIGFEKMLIKPFITWQNSQLFDFSRYHTSAEADPINNLASKEDKQHESTPSYYGGVIANYQPIKNLNINVNGYFFSSHTQYHEQDNLARRSQLLSRVNQIDGKFQMNAKVGYNINANLNLFVTARNILNQDSPEFYGTDVISRSYFAGLNFKL